MTKNTQYLTSKMSFCCSCGVNKEYESAKLSSSDSKQFSYIPSLTSDFHIILAATIRQEEERAVKTMWWVFLALGVWTILLLTVV